MPFGDILPPPSGRRKLTRILRQQDYIICNACEKVKCARETADKTSKNEKKRVLSGATAAPPTNAERGVEGKTA